MAYKIIIGPLANLDITENIEWYNKAQAGLGTTFYNQIKQIINTIRKNPFAFAPRYKKIRTATLKKFPFMVHYFVNDEQESIVIISILHTSRNPKTWDERSEK